MASKFDTLADLANYLGKGKNLKTLQKAKDDIAEKAVLNAELKAYPKNITQDVLSEKPNFTMEAPMGVPVSDEFGQLIVSPKAGLPVKAGEAVGNNLPAVRPNTLPDVVVPKSDKIIDATAEYVDPAEKLMQRFKAGGAALMGTAAVGAGMNMIGDDEIQPPMAPKSGKQMAQTSKPEDKQSEPETKVKAVQPKEIENVQRIGNDKQPQESQSKDINQHISEREEELDYLKALKDAQSKQNSLSVMSSLLGAGGALAQSVTGVKQTAADDIEEFGKRLPANVEAQRAMEEKNRELNTQRDLDDPNSPIATELKIKLKKFGVNIPDGMSVNQIQKATGLSMSALIGHEQNEKSRQEAAASRKEIASMMKTQRAEDRQDKADDRLDLQNKAQEDKRKLVLEEVEDRKRNIVDNIKIAEDMINEYGTTELMGSHNENLNRLIDNMAVDMAKLGDPKSVARPAEVQMYKQGLFTSGTGGMKLRNATALDILSKFRNEVDKRANTAYVVRGFQPNASASTPITKIPETGVVPQQPVPTRKIVSKQISRSTGKTKLTYDDGSVEIK